MPRIRRLSAAALAATLLLGVAACGDDDDGDVAQVPPAVTEPSAEPTNASSPSPSPSPSEAAADGVEVRIDLVDGKPTERPEANVDVAEGERFTLVMTSDVAQEVHVHGYDKYLTLEPDETARLSFIADKTGSWLVEIHETGAELFNLRVR